MRMHILIRTFVTRKGTVKRPAASLDSYCEPTGFNLVKASCVKVQISVIEEQCVDPDQIVKNAQTYTNFSTKSHDIWYVASPSGPLPSLIKLCPRDQKMLRPGGSDVLHRLI